MEWNYRKFSQLSADDVYLILRARNSVLVVEGAWAFQDIDGRDYGAVHVFGLVSDIAGPTVAAYARLLHGDDFDREVTIDKMFTNVAWRDDGTADRLLEHVLAATQIYWPKVPVKTQVPVRNESFYKRFGFRKMDGPSLRHGESVIGMIRSPSLGAYRAPSLSSLSRWLDARATRTETTRFQTKSSIDGDAHQ